MLQIIPISKRTADQVDSDTVKYIDNINHLDTMAKKYNRAIESYVLNSNEDVICFRHDDAEIRTPLDVCDYKIGKLTESHKVAVVGVIGTIALDRKCSWWTGVEGAGGRSTYAAGSIIQGGMQKSIDKDGKEILEPCEYPMNDFPGVHPYMATVDGCCMFFPKWFFEEGFRFDENLNSYHFYDADICLQALAAGYKVSTIDITVKHTSEGQLPPMWESLRQNFFNKWNPAVLGQWPISRLSEFHLENIKLKSTVKPEVSNGAKATENQESKPTV